MSERIAFFLPSLAGGGAERIVVNLAAGFASRGFQVDVLVARAEGAYLRSVPPPVRLVDLKASRVLMAVRPLAKYLRRERPAVVMAALNHANLATMIAARTPGVRTRTVITLHNTLSREAQGPHALRIRGIAWTVGRLHQWADAVVAVSCGVADDYARCTPLPRSRIDVIGNPVITPQLFAAAAEPAGHSWFDDKAGPVLVGAGRLTRQKNFMALIDAFALVGPEHAARLVILGEGPEREALEARIRQHRLEDRIALPGFLENPYACMARAAAFVLSSDFEGLPTVLIESLAVGTPVIATDCESGPREILRDGALGELVPVGDVPALARAIERTLTRPRPEPRADALLPFTVDAVVDRFQTLFHLDA